MDYSDHLLKVSSLSVFLGKNSILNDVNFRIGSGEFVGLVGPNGSGKTTILKTIAGLIKPETGKVLVKQKGLSDYSANQRARTIAYMPADDPSIPSMPVIDVVLAGRYPYKQSFSGFSHEDNKKALGALELTGMSNFKNRSFDTLSMGERQRVLFAQTIAQDTDIILLDEPVSNLDLYHRKEIMSIAGNLCNKGKTILAVIHDLNEASRHCSRLIVIHNGTVESEGQPRKILRPELLKTVWNIETHIDIDPVWDCLRIVTKP